MYSEIALPQLPDEPHQPVDLHFPKRSFGQKRPSYVLQLSGQVVQ